ncbi:phage tail terminator protein [Arsenophonus sp. PmNCSU2021_1]|uniref:phage tail terminator protein n=1 Tax=Arsenophonus sp. PmNCSU2021_1 TaxID=3118989 RepID=UPI002FEF7473
MKLSPVISALRTYCPRFEQRIGGAAEYGTALECTHLELPSAYVVPSGSTVGEQRSQTDYWQVLTDQFSVIVILNNTDKRGQYASCDLIDEVRSEIWRAILGWSPDPAYGAIEYADDEYLDMNQDELIWQFNFKAETEINAEDTRHYADLNNLPDLHTVAISVNEHASSVNSHLEINIK